MLKLLSLLLLFFYTTASAAFLLGVGGFDVTKSAKEYSFKDENIRGEHAYISEVLQKESKNTNTVAIWITKEWQEEWYDIKSTQEEIINRGYTPLFMFYWFADEISPEYIKENEDAYFKTLGKFTKYLKKLRGQKIVVLNPEYNMFGVEKWDYMNDIFLKSFKILREDPQVLVGPCVGDFGNYDLVNEPDEWAHFDISLHRAAKKADFIAFQEMRALTRNSELDILKTANRAYHLSQYLYKKYKKPTMLAYAAISSHGINGEKIQADVYKDFVKYLPKMKRESKLILFGVFHYFDYPGHIGYFNEAEEFFGVVRKDGSKKPAFKYFNKLK